MHSFTFTYVHNCSFLSQFLKEMHNYNTRLPLQFGIITAFYLNFWWSCKAIKFASFVFPSNFELLYRLSYFMLSLCTGNPTRNTTYILVLRVSPLNYAVSQMLVISLVNWSVQSVTRYIMAKWGYIHIRNIYIYNTKVDLRPWKI